jgi:hypothetical protein
MTVPAGIANHVTGMEKVGFPDDWLGGSKWPRRTAVTCEMLIMIHTPDNSGAGQRWTAMLAMIEAT